MIYRTGDSRRLKILDFNVATKIVSQKEENEEMRLPENQNL